MHEGNAGVSSSGHSCTPAGGSYLLSPRWGSKVGLVWWTSKARDSAGRRLLLSRKIFVFQFTLAIADSGANTHIYNQDTPTMAPVIISKYITSRLPDGSKMESSRVETLQIQDLNKQSRQFKIYQK